MADDHNNPRWIEVKFFSNGEIAEALADVLGRFVSNGVVVETETNFNSKTQENEPTGGIIVSGYLPVDQDLEEKRHKLEQALWHLGQIAPLPPAQFRPIQDEDWMAAWKVHYQPIAIGKNLLIMPAWKQPQADETRIVVRINPAMAFGTGTHPTTQLCLRLMEAHLKPGGAVIDVGCGSGILSLAALLMGTTHVLAVDVDQQAVTATRENASLNPVDPAHLEIAKGSVEEVLTDRFSIRQAPLVLVNILAPVIIRLFEQGLSELVSPDGTLLLSGILEDQEVAVIQAAEKAGFSIITRLTEGDWVGLGLTRDPLNPESTGQS